MADFAQPMSFPVDMDKGLTPRSQRSILRQGDAFANRVIAVLTSDGQPFDASGMIVVGTFIRPRDEARIDLEGEANGNEVSVLLDETCYEIPGAYTLDIMLQLGERRRTILTIHGEVEKKGSGEIVIAGTVTDVDKQLADLRALRDELTQLGTSLEAQGAAQVAAIQQKGAAQLAAIQQKGEQTLATIPDDYTALYGDVSSLKDHKADAIRDTSAKAASHTLHAQSGRISATLYGKTTETGTGDKSPDNPYTIKGVNEAVIRASGKNLFGGRALADALYEVTANTAIDEEAKKVTFHSSDTGNSTLNSGIRFKPNTQYTLIIKGRNTRPATASNVCVWYEDGNYSMLYFSDASDISYARIVTPINKTVRGIGTVVYGGITELFYEECGLFEGGVSIEDFEEYNANVITPPLLPDGEPLMEGDTVENDVLSGCDECVTVTETAAFYTDYVGLLVDDTDVVYSDWIPASELRTAEYDGVVVVSKTYLASLGVDTTSAYTVSAYLAANPLTVYYRSTAYTPEKDIRVTKVTRKMDTVLLDGSEQYWADYGSINGCTLLLPSMRSSNVAQDFYCGKYPTSKTGSFSQNGIIAGLNDSNYLYFVKCYEAFGVASLAEWKAYLSENPLEITYPLATPKVYYTDHHILRKPYGIMPVTVTGSAETAVTYPHDTKHYIDQKFDALAAALIG